MTSSSDRRRRDPRGFTLLEALCAFAILAGITGLLTQNFAQSMDRGSDALALRELREAADTIFRKMIYEHQKYDDGDSRTLDQEYGDFARLPGWQRDRWAIYAFELEKREETVIGSAPDGEQGVFDSGDDGDDPPASGQGESDSSSSAGIQLLRLTLRIYRTDETGQEPIFVLTTRIDPRKTESGATKGG